MKRIVSIVALFTVFLCLLGCHGDKKYTLELESNPSTGYRWMYEISDESIASVTESYSTDYNPDSQMAGVGGKSIFEIKPLKKGEFSLLFKYVSPDNSRVDKTVMYSFKITDDLTVKLITKE